MRLNECTRKSASLARAHVSLLPCLHDAPDGARSRSDDLRNGRFEFYLENSYASVRTPTRRRHLRLRSHHDESSHVRSPVVIRTCRRRVANPMGVSLTDGYPWHSRGPISRPSIASRSSPLLGSSRPRSCAWCVLCGCRNRSATRDPQVIRSRAARDVVPRAERAFHLRLSGSWDQRALGRSQAVGARRDASSTTNPHERAAHDSVEQRERRAMDRTGIYGSRRGEARHPCSGCRVWKSWAGTPAPARKIKSPTIKISKALEDRNKRLRVARRIVRAA